MLCRYVHGIGVGLHHSCSPLTLLVGKLWVPPPSPLATQLPSPGTELGEHVSSAWREDLAGRRKPPGRGLENPALALRRAAECGAYARPASRGLVSICPFCLRVKFAGENPTIRAKPLGGALPPPQPDPDRWKK